MGYWFNNFVEFEGKRNRENRLILNFSYVHNNKEDRRILTPEGFVSDSIKVYIPQHVLVPTGFLVPEKAEEIVKSLEERAHLKNLPLKRRRKGRFEILEIEAPNIPILLNDLKRLGFQTGNYTKLLRFGGFFPERKVSLEDRLLVNIGQRDEVELQNLDGFRFGDFLNVEEARELPYVVIDIEKPLWKRIREKELTDLRAKLLKAPKDDRDKQRRRMIDRIERRLSWIDPHVEGANLYEDKFSADVSYIGSIWKNGNSCIKEMYMIDPKNEVDIEEHNGFKILRFKNERELVEALKSAFKERRPLVAVGHNQVYDYSQIRYAADDHKVMFDPAVKDVRHRRDFVRDFLQRQREDLIYIDTLWFSRIKHPYLNQRRFGTSFKLGDLASYLGLDFEKSLTHEQLREVEMRRLAGKTLEIRKKATSEMVDYTCSDAEVTESVFHKLDPWPVLIAMKSILPFCTYTEIAFSPNVMNKLHEYKHFKDNGNLPYFAWLKQFRRQEELKLFKKEFPRLKREHLKRAGLENAPRGIYEGVTEYYVPLESWFLDTAFSINPELKKAYMSLKDNNELAFFQYLRSYMIQIFSDYFQTNLSRDGGFAQRRFYARYGVNTSQVRSVINEGYGNLAESIKNSGMRYIDNVGDYIFVQGRGKMPAVKIRELERFEKL